MAKEIQGDDKRSTRGWQKKYKGMDKRNIRGWQKEKKGMDIKVDGDEIQGAELNKRKFSLSKAG